MKLCIVSEDYPAKNHPYFAFVQNLCVELAKQGHLVYVIAPQSITKMMIRGSSLLSIESHYKVGKSKVIVYRPLYFTVGNLSINIHFLSFTRAVRSIFKKIKDDVDVCYGHFWHSAYCFYPSAKKYSKPLFVACGESEIMLHKYRSTKKLESFCDYVSGVICVSTKNLEESVNNKLTVPSKCTVLPNAIDNAVFRVSDRLKARSKYGLSDNDFVVAFVGGFIHRKGPGRIAEALKKLADPNIKSIFIGYETNGTLEIPDYQGTVFQGSLKHSQIPEALNAADVFVMPTLSEGCCNAIIEALACGLPVISSNRSFNFDILDSSNSILVDPMNIEEIGEAIIRLKEDNFYRNALRYGALKKADFLSISNRTLKIIDFIYNRMC